MLLIDLILIAIGRDVR